MATAADTPVAETLQLRPYQQDVAAQIEAGLADATARILLVMPPGAGKTEVAVKTAMTILRDNPEARFLVLAHRNILIRQTARRFRRWGMPAADATAARWRVGEPIPPEPVVVTSPRALLNRGGLDILTGSWYLLVDEAHHGPAATWSPLIRNFPGAVMGMTGTPWRLSRSEGMDDIFHQMVCGPQPEELIAAGYLSRPIVIAAKRQNIIAGGRKSHGDYTGSGIMAANDRAILTDRAVEWWLDTTRGQLQTIIYAVNKTHAWSLKEVLDAAHVTSEVILSDTPEHERDRVGEAFEERDVRCLINVAIYTEGADFRGAECILMLRPTDSLALYLQMVGRGTRINEQGRTIILDATHNTETHGLPTQSREWSLQPRGASGEGVETVKTCPECRTITGARKQECPECGEPYGQDCDRCGRWEPWSRWRARADVCDECHEGRGFDYNTQTGIILDDGWAISQQGNNYLRVAAKNATLVRQPGRDRDYKIFLDNGSRKTVRYLRDTTVDQAKRAAEEALNLRGIVVSRRIRSCRAVVESAAEMTDVDLKHALLDEAAEQAAIIAQDITDLGRTKGKSAIDRQYRDLVSAGRQARSEQALL